MTERRGGLPGAYLSILGLTMANPMTILSFGALFAGLGVTVGVTADAALVMLGVLLGSTTWWIVLTTVVGALRTRVTPTWIHRINLVSGVVIGAFAIVAIAVRAGAALRCRLALSRRRRRVGEERELEPGRTLEAGVDRLPGRAGRWRDERRPAVDEDPRRLGRIDDLEGDPDVAGDPPADLDPVDELGLAGSAISSVARPASRIATRPSGEAKEARSGRPRTSR